MPMTRDEARSKVYGRLWEWGDITKHGYLPGRAGDGQPGSRRVDAPLPVPDWHLDLTRAFADLNPATRGLASRGDTAWLLHVRFNRQQEVLWLYYVDGLGGRDTDPIPDEVIHSPRLLAKEEKAKNSEGDNRVGHALGIAGCTVREHRSNAVTRITDFVHWHDDEAEMVDNPRKVG